MQVKAGTTREATRHNKGSNNDPLPASSKVIDALAIAWRFCTNVEGGTLDVQKCVPSQAAKVLKWEKIQNYFMPKQGSFMNKMFS